MHEEAGLVVSNLKRHALLRASLYLPAISAAARMIGAALNGKGVDSQAVLLKAMEISTADVRFVMEMLAQAGHYLLGAHEDAAAAIKVFKTRLALAKIVDSFSAATHDELPLVHSLPPPPLTSLHLTLQPLAQHLLTSVPPSVGGA